MEINDRKLEGVFEITPTPLSDERGFFMRTYDNNLFKKYGIDRVWVQENHSRSVQKGIIRGLHFQLYPFSEAKLVRCIQGAITDVFVDLREGSSTFGEWDSVELNEDNQKMIFIPKGFAHGFCTLSEVSEVIYKVDNYYSKEDEVGLMWNDSDLRITWPVKNPVLSEKDKKNQSFKQFITKYKSLDV